MRSKKIQTLLLILCCLLRSADSFASHIFGGELLYTYINDTTYKLTLTLYGDCSANPILFHSLDNAEPLVYVFNNGAFTDSVRLKADSIELDVSPVCPKLLDSTTCTNGTLPGVKKFVYLDTIRIHDTSSKWSFVFYGDMGYGYHAGRSSTITNVVSAGTGYIELEADLNNTKGHNSSPRYSTIPTPFYCLNVNEQYNQGAIDADGDSLVFKMVPAYDGSTGSLVSYSFPYTATSPLSTVSGTFNFDSLNGQVNFTPNITQDGLIVIQVTEYRNGVLVGSSERELTFIVLDNCNGTPPSIYITSIAGGTATKNVINACIGTPEISFILSLTNPDGDTCYMTYHNLPPGATLDTFDNNTPNPSATFHWTTAAVTPGIYTFYTTVKNNHCPLSNTQTVAFSIDIAPIPTIADTLISPTDCIHQAYMQYTMAYGFSPRTVYIVQGIDTIKTYTDTTGIIRDSLPAGSYTAIVTSDSLCTADITFTIIDTGILPLEVHNAYFCMGDISVPMYVAAVNNTAVVVWHDAGGSVLSTAPTPNTATPGTTSWYVTEQYKVCTAGPDTVKAIVRPLPVIMIVDLPATICYGDSIYLDATGGNKYTWLPADKVMTNDNGQLYTVALSPAIFTVTATDQYGCTDTASADYTAIQFCCHFSYPDAFTPNNDGKNDAFKVLTYGNMLHYQLSIYNRWGDRVFYTEDEKKYWDGDRAGRPCDEGTYYYFFKGQCLTGHSEMHKGNVTLIR